MVPTRVHTHDSSIFACMTTAPVHLRNLILNLFAAAVLGLGSVASADVGGDFTLSRHDGRNFSLSDAGGKVVLMLFGFTHCPDVCPDTLAKVNVVMKKLGSRADQVQPLFITVDPQRDTPEKLAAYVRHFDQRLLGLTGTQQQIDAVVKKYRVQYRLGEGPAYSVDHTAHLFVIDQRGKLSRIVPYGLPMDEILTTVTALLDANTSAARDE
jgi:protein SCO1